MLFWFKIELDFMAISAENTCDKVTSLQIVTLK